MIAPRILPVQISSHSDLYGHADILRRYVGIYDTGVKVCGQIQHGWTPAAGGLSVAPIPIHVWNDRTYEALADAGVQSNRIGAPFLYLPESADPDPRVPCSLLAMPMHATPGIPFADRLAGLEAYARWLDDLRRSAGLAQVTISLTIADHSDFAMVSMLRRYGLVVATCGEQFDTAYLVRLRGYLRQHDVITSNAISTAIMYAAHLGRPLFVGGPVPARVEAAGGSVGEHLCMETADPVWIAAHFPEVPTEIDKAASLRDLGARELGSDHKKAPWELWQTVQMAYLRTGGD